jgi:hypothetical protein
MHSTVAALVSLALLLLAPARSLAQLDLPSMGSAAPAAPAAQGQRARPDPMRTGPVLRLHGGASMAQVFAGPQSGTTFYARFGLDLGGELLTAPSDLGRFALSLEYAPSLSVNGAELLHRHGGRLSLSFPGLVVSLGGGLTFLHGLVRPGLFVGGHASLAAAARFGNFSFAVPVDIDVIGPVTVVSTGLALGVTTN